MPESFTVQTFAGHFGSTFRIYPDSSNPLEMELISATELGERPDRGPAGRRQPFSIVFRGPGDVLLPQCV